MGEGPRNVDEQVQDQGDPEQGVERREEVRGNDEGRAYDQPLPYTAAPTIPVPPTRRRRTKLGVSRNRILNLPSPPSSDPEATKSDDEPLARRRRTTSPAEEEAISRVGTQPSMSKSSADAAEPFVHSVDNSSHTPVTSQPDQEAVDTTFDFEHKLDDVSIDEIFSVPFSGEIRRTEGVQVENVNVSMCEGTSKVIASAIPTPPIQVTASASTSHPLGSNNGQDAVDQAAQLHAPPSHYVSSQKRTTSEILTSLAPFLATLQSVLMHNV